jgi:hypothetical protein
MEKKKAFPINFLIIHVKRLNRKKVLCTVTIKRPSPTERLMETKKAAKAAKNKRKTFLAIRTTVCIKRMIQFIRTTLFIKRMTLWVQKTSPF